MGVFPKEPSLYNLKQGQPREYPLQVVTADGTLDAIDGVILLGGTGARATVLPVPTAPNNGGFIRIVSLTAEAHVVEATGGWNATANTTLTFGGAAGDVALVTIYNGELYVDDTTAVTIS